MGDLVDLCCSRGAKDQGDAVEQECGGKRAEKKILDGRFRTAASLFAVAGQNIGGDGGDFQCDKDQQQFDCAGEQAHADSAKDDQRVVLALMMAVFGQCIHCEKQSNEYDAADENVKEDGERAGLDRVE